MKMSNEEVIRFINNKENVRNCEQCPYNYGTCDRGLPCGQQHCWVTVHVNHR